MLRFDGVRAVPLQLAAGEHLPSDFVYSLIAGRDGRLWIGTRKGLASWKDGKLTNYAELSGQVVSSLLEDHEGVVWAGTTTGTAGRLCAIRNGGVECYGQDGNLGRLVLSLHEENGRLWVGAESGVWQWRPGPPKLFTIAGPPGDLGGLSDDHGRLLISTRSGIQQLVDGKVEAYPISVVSSQFIPRQLLRDRDGGLWIGTADRGLVHVHQGRTDRFVQSDGLSDDSINFLSEDREGNIWVASAGGLDRFRDFSVPTISARQGLAGDNVFSVLADSDGSVWVASREGLSRWNTGIFKTYGKESGLPYNPHSLFQDHAGRVWATTRHGLAYFQNGRFVEVDLVRGGEVHAIAEDGAGGLLLSRDDGLNRLLDRRVVQQTPWSEPGNQGAATSLVTDPVRGGEWLGLFPSGFIYAEGGKVRNSYSDAAGFGGGEVGGIQVDRDGTVWASTEGGLSRLKDGRIATLTSRNGLPCDNVHWMMEDDDHSVWLYMACGLVRIARSELDAWAANPKRAIQTVILDSSDGIGVHPALISGGNPRVTKATDGKLWFIGGTGVSVLDPRRLSLNKVPPPVRIEQVTADRKTYWQNSSGEASSNLRLPPLVRDLEIDYTALSLVVPEKDRFRIRLEGRDPDWKDAGNERKAFYNDLPPRSYRFRVMASNNSGVWNEAGAAFDFSIAPAYYQARWFQALCVVAFLGLLWGLHRYRLRQIAQRFNVQLEARVGERTRIARDLHDTLLQSFQGLMLRLQVVDDLLPGGRAKEELELALDRADRAIAEGRDAVRDLRLSATTTNELAAALRAVGDELAADGSADFRVVVEGATRELHPVVRDEVYRIVREALRNAFRHSGARKVEAEISYEDLWSMVEQKKFRADLYYRLNVFPMTLPPLRERDDDIPRLAEYFVQKFAARQGKSIDAIPEEVMEALKQHHWPGNIRELQNVIERGVIMTTGSVLCRQTAEHIRRDRGFAPAPITSSERTSLRTLAEAQREHIKAMLHETNWVIGGPRGAAAQLGLPRTTLIARMRRLGIANEASEQRAGQLNPQFGRLGAMGAGDSAGGFRRMEVAAGGAW